MKVYLVTTGSYSEYSIEHICEKKELAEKLATHYGDEANEIEEWELTAEDSPIGKLPKDTRFWTIFFSESGEITYCHESFCHSLIESKIDFCSKGKLYWEGLATNKEAAIKIATEQRIYHLANLHLIKGAEKK